MNLSEITPGDLLFREAFFHCHKIVIMLVYFI